MSLVVIPEDGLSKLYGRAPQALGKVNRRFEALMDFHLRRFSEENKPRFFSAPGRTELSGNHTDHQGGKVLSAAVTLDTIACVTACDEPRIKVCSGGFDETFQIDLEDLTPRQAEKGTTQALIRGVAACMKEAGFKAGGFKASVESNVAIGSGLSSSAAFEVLIGLILNELYNKGRVSQVQLAQIAQRAENEWFGKPCGLMDQLACALGGINAFDFSGKEPKISPVEVDLEAFPYVLAIVDSGGDHADLTRAYAEIPEQMNAVAVALGKTSGAEITLEILTQQLPLLRTQVSDQAILRTMHLITENQRVSQQVEALSQKDFKHFLRLVKDSGNSSWKWLQNVMAPGQNQNLALALAMTELFLNSKGACRVHGGGFAGTIQVWLPKAELPAFQEWMAPPFGADAVTPLHIRSYGAMEVK